MFRSGPKWLIYQECSFIQRSIYVECTVLYIRIFSMNKYNTKLDLSLYSENKNYA